MICVRRPSSFWTVCPCPPCRTEMRHKAKVVRTYGTIPRVTADQAWEVLDRLLADGWTGLAIATAADVPRRSIEGAITEHRRSGHRNSFGPTISARIVGHGHPTAGQIGSTGARRRLQGLAWQQWDLTLMAAHTGVNETTLAAIRSGATRRVNVRHHDAIVEATNSIGMKVGPSVQARQNAQRKNWVGLLAWDTIDDPNETPSGVGYTPPSRADALRELADRGAGITEATRRLNVSQDSLQRWCSRNGQADVYRKLARRESLSSNHQEDVA